MLSKYKKLIDIAIVNMLSAEINVPGLAYSLEFWWKRLRPILTLMTYEHLSSKEASEEIIKASLALELIHSYTLVHDDLPCMDNDTERRWKPSVWAKYWESSAVLVWDALQPLAFSLISSYPDAVKILSKVAYEVVIWQSMDLSNPNKDTITTYKFKTWALFAWSLGIWWVLAQANNSIISKLQDIGYMLWILYQIKDDVQDQDGITKTDRNYKQIYSDYQNELIKSCNEINLNFLPEFTKQIGLL